MKVISFIQAVAFILFFSFDAPSRSIEVCDIYSGDSIIWDADTVKITCDVAINGTLIIRPGTYVEFQGYYELMADSIFAFGNRGDSITFTIHDTAGFFNTNISDGGWKKITAIQYAEFNFCRIMFGKNLERNSQAYNLPGLIKINGDGRLRIRNSNLFYNYSQSNLIENYWGYSKNQIQIINSCFKKNNFKKLNEVLCTITCCSFFENIFSIYNAVITGSFFDATSG